MERTTNSAPATQADNVVLGYPDNRLKKQVRELEDAFDVVVLLRKTFFEQK